MEDEDLGMEMFSGDFDLNLEDLGLDTETRDVNEEPKDGLDDNPNKNENNNPDEDNDLKDNSPENVVKDKDNKTDGDDPASQQKPADNTSPDLYKSLVTVLAEEGILSEVEETDIKSVKDVIGLIEGEIKRQEYADLNDFQKEAIEAYRDGIPVERFNKQKEVELKLENITEEAIAEDENLRRQLIFQEFKLNGFSDAKAQALMERSFAAEADLEDAKGSLLALKKNVKEKFAAEREAARQQVEDSKKREQDKQKKIKDLVFNTDEVIKGYTINQGLKKKVYSEIYNPTNVNPDTGKKENNLMKYQRENPEEFMHKLYYLFTVTKGFEDFSYFKTKEKSRSTNELEDAIRRNAHISGGGDPSFVDDPNSSFIIGDDLYLEE